MNRSKLFITALMLALVLALGVGSAQASNINTLTVNSYNLTQGVNVTLYGSNLGTKYGAEFFVHLDLGNNNFQDVVGYCIDLYQSIGTGNYYSYTLDPVSSSASTQAAAWLLGHYDPSLGNPINGNLSTTITALQVAIWEVTYDYSASGSYSLSAGNIKFNNLDSTVAALASSYLTALGSANPTLTGLNFSGVARSAYNQDLIVGNVGAVPEPGTMLLFGSAAGLMGWWRRRQTKPAEEAQA